ncbi:MAG: hypothetical protein RL741_1167, partial [Actinomycetota bacterium]
MSLTTQTKTNQETAPRPKMGWLITDSISVSRRHLLKITRVPESLF